MNDYLKLCTNYYVIKNFCYNKNLFYFLGAITESIFTVIESLIIDIFDASTAVESTTFAASSFAFSAAALL